MSTLPFFQPPVPGRLPRAARGLSAETVLMVATDACRPTLADFLARYQQEPLPHTSQQTQAQNVLVIRAHFQPYLYRPLTDLTPEVIRQWRERLSAQCQPGTVRNYLARLAGMLTLAVETYGWLPAHPMARLHKPAEPAGRVRFLSEAERPRLLAACHQSRNRVLYLIVLLALSTGCRKNEIRCLRWEAVDVETGVLRLMQTKTKTRRAIAVTGPALDALRAHHATRRLDTPWVFPRKDGRKPVLIDQAWHLALERAGITDFRFHDTRHSAATALALSGASLLDIADVLGHKKLEHTRRYTHLTAPHMRGVLARMTTSIFPEGAPDAPTMPDLG